MNRENKAAINKGTYCLPVEIKNLNKQAGPSVNPKIKIEGTKTVKKKTDVKAAKKRDIQTKMYQKLKKEAKGEWRNK